MVLYLIVSDKESPQVSGTLLRILVDFNNVVVSTRPQIYNWSRPLLKPLEIVPRAPITIRITVTFMLNSFFGSLARYLSLFSFSLIFLCGPLGRQGPLFDRFSFLFFFLFIYYHWVWASGRDYMICLYLEIPENLLVSFSRTDSSLCMYHFVVWANFSLAHKSLWTTFPTLNK